jgi:hypothetical protein
LTSAHQETGAIDGPLAFWIHECFLSPVIRAAVLFLILTEHGQHSEDTRFRWSDCTRTTRVGQFHKNGATVEFDSRIGCDESG